MDNAAVMDAMAGSDETDGGMALAHARSLLRALGMDGDPRPMGEHPALAWRRSGLMAVTGRADGPGLVCPVPLTAAADGALSALRALAPDAPLPGNGAMLLGERARLLGLTRQGATSANGSCRLLATRDGHVALNLPRQDDWDLIPALLEDVAPDWPAIERLAAGRSSDELVERGCLLGMAIAVDRRPEPLPPFVVQRIAAARPASDAAPLVVDLSALWAGPLAASLLGMAGARVVKVESTARPDGARLGHAGFYALLNVGKKEASFDFRDAADLAQLRGLIDRADIVIEGSRPRALAQLGIRAEDVAARGGTWVSITAHGRSGAGADRIGFGDDAAIAGGLGAAMGQAWGEPLFAGDAIADPLTGITAALAGWAGWRSGGGCIIALSLATVIAHACALSRAEGAIAREWQAIAGADHAPLYPLRSKQIGF
jgi:crotonobetainyl-CoA:carnitine CoA-transferase CaiB-like acyl-CoA transferase